MRPMVSCEMLRLRLSDGYEGFARLWMPLRPRGGLLYLHGIQSHGQWYEASAQCLAEAGLAVLLPDRRGSGRNEQARGHTPSARQLLHDVGAYLDELHVQTGLARVHLLGVSWGGKLALAYQRRDPARVASLTLVAPGLFPKVDLPLGKKARVALSAVTARKALFDIPLSDPALFTANPKRQAFIRDDPLALKQVTASFLLASRRLDRDARGVDRQGPSCPLRLLLAEYDRIIDNDKTSAFVRSLAWPDRTITVYDNAHHTLEFEPDPQRYFDDLVGWYGSIVDA